MMEAHAREGSGQRITNPKEMSVAESIASVVSMASVSISSFQQSVRFGGRTVDQVLLAWVKLARMRMTESCGTRCRSGYDVHLQGPHRALETRKRVSERGLQTV